MQYCKETHQALKIAEFYERALKKFEENSKMIGTVEHEELLTTLFYAYVRIRDFNKQQQIALKLFKQSNKMMYCFWNAASYVMMSKGLESGTELTVQQQQQKGMYLVLAEKILQKAYQDQNMEYNGEFLLFLNILEGKNKFAEALDIVNEFSEEKHLSKIGQTDFKTKKKIIYFKQMKKWTGLRFVCEQFISDSTNANIDDWLTYQSYIESLIEIYKELNDEELKENLIKETFSFFASLIDRIECKDDKNAPKAQSPYMARIEFINQLVSIKKEGHKEFINKHMSDIKSFLEAYLNQYAGKPGFYFDFVFFNDFIIELNLKDFVIEKLKEIHDKSVPFKNIKSIYTCLSYWQLHRRFGFECELSDDDSVKIADKLETYYTEALEFGKDLLPTSVQYADEFLIQATHLRFDVYIKNPSEENSILQIIVNLKNGLIKSPSNYQFKLILLNIYSHLGAYDALYEMYKSMDIKNIQNYSTSNLLLIHNMRLGSIVSSINTYATIGHFFLSNIFDMSNFLVHCYKYGSFLKAVEIFSFINTIRKSLTLNMCLSNFMSISFIMQSTNLTPIQSHSVSSGDLSLNKDGSEDDLQDFKTLHSTISNHLKEMRSVSNVFNSETGLLPDDLTQLNNLLLDHNDKDILFNWDPENKREEGRLQYESVVTEQRILLKLRNLMIRFVDVYFKQNLPDATTISESDLIESCDMYRQKLINFDYHIEALQNEQEFDSKLKIYVTKSFYLNRWSQLSLDKIIALFTNLTSELSVSVLLKFLEKEQQNNQKELNNYRDDLRTNFKQFKLKLNEFMINFDKNKSKEFKIENVASILECFSSSLEAISFVIVLVSMALSNATLRPIWIEKVKKSKKKKGQYVQFANSIDIIFEIYEILCQLVNFLHLQLDQIICPNILNMVRMVCSSSEINDNKLLTDIGNSYVKSFEEMRNIYAAKLKYLLKFSEKTIVRLDEAVKDLEIE